MDAIEQLLQPARKSTTTRCTNKCKYRRRSVAVVDWTDIEISSLFVFVSCFLVYRARSIYGKFQARHVHLDPVGSAFRSRPGSSTLQDPSAYSTRVH